MPLSVDILQSSEREGLILSDVRERQGTGKWGFEVFTSGRVCIARFIYSSETEARRAAEEFAWVMEKISSVSSSTQDPLKRDQDHTKLRSSKSVSTTADTREHGERANFT